MKIERESFTPELAAEVLPLAQKCWEESTGVKGETCAYYGHRAFAVEPNMDCYRRFAEQGVLAFIALRVDKRLVGYLIGFAYQSTHHREILCAAADSIYIEPDYRSYTAVAVKKFENELKALGAQIIGWPTHVDGPVYPVLKALGYVGDDIVMEKLLCVLQ